MGVAPCLGVLAPVGKRLLVGGTDILLFACSLDEGVVVGEGAQLHIGLGKVLLGHGKAVGEDGRHAFHHAAALAQGMHGDEAALARGHQVLNHHHRLPGMNLAFYLVGKAVGFGLGTHIHKRFAQLLGYQCPLGYAACGHAGHDIHVAPALVHHIDEALTDEGADFGIGKSHAVVAINRRFATRRPCEGMLVVEFYCLDLQ